MFRREVVVLSPGRNVMGFRFYTGHREKSPCGFARMAELDIFFRFSLDMAFNTRYVDL
jgi:hypothetical protein